MTVTDFASVTVAYGSADVIGDVVGSLADLPGCAEVVVVDNGRDGSGSLAEACGASVIRRPENPGFGRRGQRRGRRDHAAPPCSS